MRPSPVRIIQVVETRLLVRGSGREGDPFRQIAQYWSLDGQLLAEADSLLTGRGELFTTVENTEASAKEDQHGKDQSLRDDG